MRGSNVELATRPVPQQDLDCLPTAMPVTPWTIPIGANSGSVANRVILRVPGKQFAPGAEESIMRKLRSSRRRKLSGPKRALFRTLLPLVLGVSSAGAETEIRAEVIDLRIGDHKTYVRVVVELDNPASYRIERDHGGAGVVLTVDARAKSRQIESPSAPVGSVAISSSGNGSKVKIELLRDNLRVKEMVLVDPPRIVLDFFTPDVAGEESSSIKAPEPKAQSPTRAATSFPASNAQAPAPAPEKTPALSWPTEETSGTSSRGATADSPQPSEGFPAPGSEIPGPDASTADFDHFRTRFPLLGGHERVSCEKCHVAGTFQGTPGRCSICHDGSGVRSDSGKGVTHIRTTNECEDCHLQVAWSPARLDHAAVIGGCTDCHNGFAAPGKHPGHIASSNDCESCHRTMTWAGARFNHAKLVGTCFSCHNGISATGKSPGHLQTSNLCEDCHSPGFWTNTHFNHSGITSNCFSCHNGLSATGKHPGHLQSSNTCEDCHSPGSWASAGFDHSGTTGNCFSCHNGVDATGKNLGHTQSTNTCEDCHSPGSWLNVNFDHAAVTGSCGSCHSSDFRSEPHIKVESPRILYNSSELNDCTGACHIYTDPSLSTILTRRPRHHSIPPGEW